MGRFLRLHESLVQFRRALSVTEARTGFSQRLIEKDYYCSLILADLTPLYSCGLTFKGGTCLSKVHAGFFRLSEDLDFAMSIAPESKRADRRRMISPIKEHLESLSIRLPMIEIVEPLKGYDNCRQYNGVLRYTSAIIDEQQTLKIQVAVREHIVEPTLACGGRTLLIHPTEGEIPHSELSLRVLSLRETYAEKVRAALTRNPPAIRDIFDLDNAIQTKTIDPFESQFLKLVEKKLLVPGNHVTQINDDRRTQLENQLHSHLKPVLKSDDFNAFQLDKALKALNDLEAKLTPILQMNPHNQIDPLR